MDSMAHEVLTAENIQYQFSLSKAEASVCYQLCIGLSVEQIAERNSRELCTVRSQMKALFRKTNTRRQGELVARVMGHLLAQQQQFLRAV